MCLVTQQHNPNHKGRLENTWRDWFSLNILNPEKCQEKLHLLAEILNFCQLFSLWTVELEGKELNNRAGAEAESPRVHLWWSKVRSPRFAGTVKVSNCHVVWTMLQLSEDPEEYSIGVTQWCVIQAIFQLGKERISYIRNKGIHLSFYLILSK